jgi:hypothetical protein
VTEVLADECPSLGANYEEQAIDFANRRVSAYPHLTPEATERKLSLIAHSHIDEP